MLNNILSFILPSLSFYFGGGGSDNTSEKIREDEQRREAGMASASRDINSIFGIHDPANFDASGNFIGNSGMYWDPTTRTTTVGTRPNEYPGNATIGGEGWMPNPMAGTEGPFGTTRGQYVHDPNYTGSGATAYPGNAESGGPGWELSSDAGRRGYPDYVRTPGYAGPGSAITTTTTGSPYGDLAESAYRNNAAREAGYGKSRGDIMNFFTQGLDEQLRDSSQEMTYDLARRGLLKGSEDFQAENRRTERYDDALIGLTNEADTATDKLRTSDEQSRLGLLSSIRAGMDRESAMAGATSALTNNMNNATNAAHAVQFGGVFDDLNQLYKSGVYTKGVQSGINNPYRSSYSPGSSGRSYTGSTY